MSDATPACGDASEGLRSQFGNTIRTRAVYVIGCLIVILVGLYEGLEGMHPDVVARVLFTIAPLVLFVLAIAAAVSKHSWLAVGAIVVAVPPGALSSVASGERHGALALLAVAGAVLIAYGVRSVKVSIVAACAYGTISLALWWASAPPSEAFGPPGWDVVVSDTGRVFRVGFSEVGIAGVPVPESVHIVWWCLVGVVVGCALLDDRARRAGLVPIAVVVYVLSSWVIVRWRGPVDGAGGMWLLSATIAYTGASTDLGGRRNRSIGRALVVLGGGVWLGSLVQLVRFKGSSPLFSVGFSAVILAFVGVVWVVSGATQWGRDVRSG